jgi:ABC-type transport system substrate-binding protein
MHGWYAIDDLLDQQATILDFNKRKEVVKQILTKMIEDYPVVCTNFFSFTRASAGYVLNWTPAPPQPFEYHYKTFLDKELKEQLGF